MRGYPEDDIDTTFKPDSRFIEGEYADIIEDYRAKRVCNVFHHGENGFGGKLNVGLFSAISDLDTIHDILGMADDGTCSCLGGADDEWLDRAYYPGVLDLFEEYEINEWEPDLRF